ncbi:MAG TPA: MFS transporter [Phycisphaerae bacterium]|nr:MFS transporter [Phycisphaerae bacterium]
MPILPQVVAYPESAQVLRRQVVASVFLTTRWAVLAILPYQLVKHFGAPDFYSIIATMATPAMMLLSVFWGGLYRRTATRRYVWVYWLVGVLPIAGIALSYSPAAALGWLLVGSVASAGMVPISGDIMRACYPPGVRGRVMSVLMFASIIANGLAAYGVGKWLDFDSQAFRLYLPLAVVIQLGGVALLASIGRLPLFLEREQSLVADDSRTSLLRRFVKMWSVLVEDRDFRRFEVFFMLYGAGWMVCWALLPLLVYHRLNLAYGDFNESTQVAFQATMLVAILVAGRLVDRLGPVRLAALAFGWLALYPIALMLAQGVWSLTIATVIYAMGMAPVNVVWTLGPITLARRAGDASRYLSVHGSMVGVRAIIFQPLGWLLYNVTGSFVVPLTLATVLLVLGCAGMWGLDRSIRARR